MLTYLTCRISILKYNNFNSCILISEDVKLMFDFAVAAITGSSNVVGQHILVEIYK